MVNAGPLWQASATLATGFVSSPVEKSEVMPMMTPASIPTMAAPQRRSSKPEARQAMKVSAANTPQVR